MEDPIVSYWQHVLERIDKPSARRLLGDVDIRQPLGVRQQSGAKKGPQPPLFEFFKRIKRDHPFCVLLVRVRTRPLPVAAPCTPDRARG